MYKIKELRLERGWTQEYLGSLLNVNKSAISKYENGRSDLTAGLIIKLTKIFLVSADYLLGISSTKTNSGYAELTSDKLPLLESDAYTLENSFTQTNQKLLHYYHRLNEENKDAAKGYMVHLYKDEKISLKQKK